MIYLYNVNWRFFMSKFYAVKKGRQTGIFYTWPECEAQVKGYKGAIFKSFVSEKDAQRFLSDEKKEEDINSLLAYVDGSYNVKTKEYGYGCILLEGQKEIIQINGKGNDENYVTMRNVAGEIIGSEKAIRYAIEHGYSSLHIYYDYEGIEKWATGQWKANKSGTQAYQRFVQESQKKISISFVKVLAHSGDYYNEKADLLAKKAVGLA